MKRSWLRVVVGGLLNAGVASAAVYSGGGGAKQTGLAALAALLAGLGLTFHDPRESDSGFGR